MRVNAILGKALVCAGSLAAVLALSANAHAAERTHDGFYLSMNAGIGYLSSSAEQAGVEVNYSGVTMPAAIWLGGTVGPVVIGGGFFADYSFSPTMEVNGGAGGTYSPDNVSQTLLGIGAFADYYIDPHGGFHLQPFLGWGGLETSVDGDSGGSDPTGLVMALGVGYDFWVASEWSLGVMGRFAYAPLSLNDVGYSTIAPALLFTATYH